MEQQTLLVLMGLPGAGKTQLAQQLERMGWAVVGSVQQTLQASQEACTRALSNGQNGGGGTGAGEVDIAHTCVHLLHQHHLPAAGVVRFRSTLAAHHTEGQGADLHRTQSPRHLLSLIRLAALQLSTPLEECKQLMRSRLGPAKQREAADWERHIDSAGTKLDGPNAEGVTDTRIIILFDLNGTITSHTSKRQSSGSNKPRPGTASLLLLREKFRLGIFTSATIRTCAAALEMLETAAGDGQLFERGLVMHRDHTIPVSKAHVAAGGDPWDTRKPLAQWFTRMHRVVLVDDDAYKAMEEELSNLVQVPCWAEVGQDKGAECAVLPQLVDSLLKVLGPLGPDADVRPHTAEVTKAVQDAWEKASAAAAAAAETPPLDTAPLGLNTALTAGVGRVGEKGLTSATAVLVDTNEIDITA
ncbi:MAG: hypothetical protein WDW38_007000 [Sanguina aurantia]